MKLIYEPSVYVVGCQMVCDDGLGQFLADHGISWETDEVAADGESLVEIAGRLCYMSYANPRPGGNKAYLDHILEAGHGSVAEHAVWNFVITGVSRSLTHELIRHRAGFGFSELSQRYVDASDFAFVVPPDLEEEVRGEQLPGLWWKEAVAIALARYAYLADYLARKAESQGLTKTEARKYARQAARSVLPNATETKIFVTANARALRHFLEMRGSKHAEPEIRRLANVILGEMRNEAPNLFGDYELTPLPDGTSEITTKFRKV